MDVVDRAQWPVGPSKAGVGLPAGAGPRAASLPLTVVIVEDDAAFRAVLAHTVMCCPRLNLLGVASSIASARRLLAAQAPDILLVDLGLPDGHGIDLIRHAAAHLPGCDSMVITSVSDSAQVVAAIEAGANGYLYKEEPDVDVAARIESLHAGGSPISPLIARHLLARLQRADRPAALADGKPAPRRDDVTPLSTQETAVLLMISKGYSHDDIARAMSVSRATVQTYVKRSYRKLQVHSKTEAVYEARCLGWLGA